MCDSNYTAISGSTIAGEIVVNTEEERPDLSRKPNHKSELLSQITKIIFY